MPSNAQSYGKSFGPRFIWEPWTRSLADLVLIFKLATMTSSLMTTHWGRVRLVHRIYYPVLAWPIKLLAYAMPSFPVPPIMLLTDMVTRSRLLAAHGLTSCLSVRTQPLTATGAPSQTSTIPYHTMGVLPSTQPVATLGSSFILSSFDMACACCVPFGWRC